MLGSDREGLGIGLGLGIIDRRSEPNTVYFRMGAMGAHNSKWGIYTNVRLGGWEVLRQIDLQRIV